MRNSWARLSQIPALPETVNRMPVLNNPILGLRHGQPKTPLHGTRQIHFFTSQTSLSVIPAKAGIHAEFMGSLVPDSRPPREGKSYALLAKALHSD